MLYDKDSPIDQEALRVRTSSCPDGPIGTTVLMNARDFFVVLVIVAGDLTMRAQRFAHRRHPAVARLLHDAAQRPLLDPLPEVTVVEHLAKLGGTNPADWERSHGR